MSAPIGDSILFHRIFVFLIIYTCIVGVVNLAASGSIGTSDIANLIGAPSSPNLIPGQFVPGTGTGYSSYYIEGSNTAEGTVLTEIDFASISTINPNITTPLGGTWSIISGQGAQLTSLPYFGALPYLNPSVIVIRNMRSSNSVYTWTTNVNNVPNANWYIFPRYITGYSGSDLKVVMASDGIHVKKFPLSYGMFDAGDDYYYPYSNAQNLPSITASLTEAVSTQNSNVPDSTAVLTISSNGNQLFTTNVRSILPGLNINDQVRHGGAGSDSTGFIIQSFTETSVLDNSSSILSGDSSTKSSYDSAAFGFNMFLALIAGAVGISENSLIPFWFSALVIGSCSATLSYLSLKMARGN